MKRLLIPIMLTICVSGCAQVVVPTKAEAEKINGIAILIPDKYEHSYVFCTECPKPTEKTLAVRTEAPKPQQIVLPTPEKAVAVPLAVPLAVPDQMPKRVPHIVLFQHNSSTLDETAQEILAHIAAEILAKNIRNIEIHGYSDELGKADFNMYLSLRRANAVATQLRKLEVKAAMMVAAEGKCCYVAGNADENSRRLNRRSEVVYVESSRAGK